MDWLSTSEKCRKTNGQFFRNYMSANLICVGRLATKKEDYMG